MNTNKLGFFVARSAQQEAQVELSSLPRHFSYGLIKVVLLWIKLLTGYNFYKNST